MKVLYPLTKSIFAWIFKTFYHHKIIGHVPPGGAIIAPNHVSFFDPPIIAISIDEEVYFLAKDSLFNIPLFGYLITQLNAIPVSHSSKTLIQISKHLKTGKKVTIFPEGHRMYENELGDLEKGCALLALKAQVPIIPAYITGAHSIWPRKQWLPKLTGHTTCTFGKPIPPKQFEHLDKKEAVKAMTAELEKALQELSKGH